MTPPSERDIREQDPKAQLREMHESAMRCTPWASVVRDNASKEFDALLAQVPDAGAREEAAWFRWLNENPQAAAYLAVQAAQSGPIGPSLRATMESGEVVGFVEDAQQPEYRFTCVPTEEVTRLRAEVDKHADDIREWQRTCESLQSALKTSDGLRTEAEVEVERLQTQGRDLGRAEVERARREVCEYLFEQFERRPAVDKNVALAVVESTMKGHKYPAPPSAPPAAPPFVHDAMCELNVGAFACACGSRPPAPRPESSEECARCDGCGWYEGGKALKTHCEKCDGTGRVQRSR